MCKELCPASLGDSLDAKVQNHCLKSRGFLPPSSAVGFFLFVNLQLYIETIVFGCGAM